MPRFHVWLTFEKKEKKILGGDQSGGRKRSGAWPSAQWSHTPSTHIKLRTAGILAQGLNENCIHGGVQAAHKSSRITHEKWEINSCRYDATLSSGCSVCVCVCIFGDDRPNWQQAEDAPPHSVQTV